MAEPLILTDCEFTVTPSGGSEVDLSADVEEITINYGAEVKDVSAMNSAAARNKRAGLKDWSVDVTFVQDYSAGRVNATLFPLVGANGTTVSIKGVAGTAASATNPRWYGTAILSTYPPLAGAVGEGVRAGVTFDGYGVLTPGTSD